MFLEFCEEPSVVIRMVSEALPQPSIPTPSNPFFFPFLFFLSLSTSPPPPFPRAPVSLSCAGVNGLSYHIQTVLHSAFQFDLLGMLGRLIEENTSQHLFARVAFFEAQ